MVQITALTAARCRPRSVKRQVPQSSAWLDVTWPITPEMVVWPGQPQTERRRTSSMEEGKSSNVSTLTMSVHTGTHMDAPLHFYQDGADITAAPFEAMFGPVRVAEIIGEVISSAQIRAYEARAGELKPGERLFFKTKNSARDWLTEPFDENYIAVSAEAASYLAERETALVGVDYLSVAPFAATYHTHRILLGAGIWVIEGLDLRNVREGQFELAALPLKIVGGDASPIRVLLRPA